MLRQRSASCTVFADHLGFRLELASVPRSETSFVVYFRRKMEQPQ